MKISHKPLCEGHINSCGFHITHSCPQHRPREGLNKQEPSRSTQPRHYGQKTEWLTPIEAFCIRIPGSLLCRLSSCSHHLMKSLPKRKWNNLFLYETLGVLKPGGWLRNGEITWHKESHIRNAVPAPNLCFQLISRKFHCSRNLLSCRGQPQASNIKLLSRLRGVSPSKEPTFYLTSLPFKTTASSPDGGSLSLLKTWEINNCRRHP